MHNTIYKACTNAHFYRGITWAANVPNALWEEFRIVVTVEELVAWAQEFKNLGPSDVTNYEDEHW